MAAVTRAFEVAGHRVSIGAGAVAGRAAGAVLIREEDTVVLCVATIAAEPGAPVGFVPLTCDYEERQYATGRIPRNPLRREGAPGERAILTSRLIDRSLRPTLAAAIGRDVQVVATLLSADGRADPAVLAINGASAALAISEIPFAGPVGAVRVGLIDGELVVNPRLPDLERSELDLVVAGTPELILMLEAGARCVAERLVMDGVAAAHEAIGGICAAQRELRLAAGRPKLDVTPSGPDPGIVAAVEGQVAGRLDAATFVEDKVLRGERVSALKREVVAALGARRPGDGDLAGAAFDRMLRERVRQRVVADGVRVDGRGPADVRRIEASTGVLPGAHGSCVFRRGQTQVLSVVTLASAGDDGEAGACFVHHYSMPPYATGRAQPPRPPTRREIGHGALVERALAPVVPAAAEWPYAMHLVSEVLSSSGSTSMASVCGCTLAMLDAGVPIHAPVAGIAMGLVDRGDHPVLLTDIQGIEDAFGDMDLKVAGPAGGITALQLDCKAGLARETLAAALERARDARRFVLGRMLDAVR